MLTALLLLATSFTVWSPINSSGRTKPQTTAAAKMSADLARQRQKGGRARIIIQLKQRPSSLFDSLLSTLGGERAMKLNSLNLRVVDLPVTAVEALAARDDVRFI